MFLKYSIFRKKSIIKHSLGKATLSCDWCLKEKSIQKLTIFVESI